MFDHLDDPSPPPSLDEAMPLVESHRRRLIRRRRIAAAMGASSVVVAVVATTVTLAHGGALSLHTTVPVASPSATSRPAATPVTSPVTTAEVPATITPPPTTNRTTSTPTVPPVRPTIAPVQATSQITYRPFTASGQVDPSLRVTSTDTGTCSGYGDGAGRTYYRCIGGSGGVYDPCFASSLNLAAPLVCPTDPATPDVVRFTAASGGPPNLPPSAARQPWAMQLSNGESCRFVSAAWSGLGPYACQPTSITHQPVADCRQPTPGQPSWIADCQDQMTNASPFGAKQVTKVWF
jgi:hypothetical protein